LTVAPAHSDALLRALLTAGPPWHIRSLAAAPGPAESPGADRTPAHGAATGPHDRSTPEAP
ncbi:ABC transporter ATP-binding protein, partial [Streptomyces sp. NPDC006510]